MKRLAVIAENRLRKSEFSRVGPDIKYSNITFFIHFFYFCSVSCMYQTLGSTVMRLFMQFCNLLYWDSSEIYFLLS